MLRVWWKRLGVLLVLALVVAALGLGWAHLALRGERKTEQAPRGAHVEGRHPPGRRAAGAQDPYDLGHRRDRLLVSAVDLRRQRGEQPGIDQITEVLVQQRTIVFSAQRTLGQHRGKFTGEIKKLDYLEGNSNQGDGAG